MIKIKSTTDVITNSSTEVYCYYSDDSVTKLYECIQSMFDCLGILDDPKKIFDIELEENEYLREQYEEAKLEKNFTEGQSFEDWLENSYYDEYPRYDSISITTNVERFKDFAKKFKKIATGDIFSTAAIFG